MNLLILSVLLVLSGLCETKHRGEAKHLGIPRRVRTDPTKREDNVEAKPKDIYERCMGFAGLVPPQPFTIPDDTDNISLIVRPPAEWVLRDIDSIPNPFLAGDVVEGTAYFCMDGEQKLFSVYSFFDDNIFLEVEKNGIRPTYPGVISVGGLYWELVSIRDSPVQGNIIVDIRVFGYSTKCVVTLDNIGMDNPSNCDGDESKILTLHSVKYMDYYTEYCPDCWIGVFTLCSTAECTERVISIKINNEVIPLLPIVLTTQKSEPP